MSKLDNFFLLSLLFLASFFSSQVEDAFFLHVILWDVPFLPFPYISIHSLSPSTILIYKYIFLCMEHTILHISLTEGILKRWKRAATSYLNPLEYKYKCHYITTETICRFLMLSAFFYYLFSVISVCFLPFLRLLSSFIPILFFGYHFEWIIFLCMEYINIPKHFRSLQEVIMNLYIFLDDFWVEVLNIFDGIYSFWVLEVVWVRYLERIIERGSKWCL